MRSCLPWIGGAEFGWDRGVDGCTDVAGTSEIRIKAAEPHRRAGEFCSVMGPGGVAIHRQVSGIGWTTRI
jgi:hypothetical protein